MSILDQLLEGSDDHEFVVEAAEGVIANYKFQIATFRLKYASVPTALEIIANSETLNAEVQTLLTAYLDQGEGGGRRKAMRDKLAVLADELERWNTEINFAEYNTYIDEEFVDA